MLPSVVPLSHLLLLLLLLPHHLLATMPELPLQLPLLLLLLPPQ